MKIPFLSFEHMHKPLKSAIVNSFEKFYDSNWFILGNNVRSFEDSYSKFNDVKYAVGVSNGLDALHLCLKTLGVGPGDEVIVPSNTYIATILAVSYLGATPIMVEPDSKTFNLDPNKIEAALTKKTKVILPVHLYGQSCDMRSIMQIAKKHDLMVVEDNAQSHGSTWHGKITGSWGDVNATSFYPGKNLGALGDGGCVTTDNEKLAASVKMFRNYGSEKKYYNEVIGYNMRLDECQAGFLSVKLPFLKKWTSQRKEIAGWYDHHLEGIEQIELPFKSPEAEHVYHLYVIRSNNRDGLQAHLKNNDIETLIHYPIPPHLQIAYKHLGFKKGDFPISESMAETCLSLPIWPGITEGEIKFISATIKDFFTKSA